MRDSAAVHNVAGVIGQHDQGEEPSEMHSEFVHQFERFRVSGEGLVADLLRVQAFRAEELLRAEVFEDTTFVGQGAEFSGSAVHAVEDFSVDDHSYPGPCSECDADDHLGGLAEPCGRSHHEAVCVVVERDGDSECLLKTGFEGDFLPRRDVGGVVDDALFGVHECGHAYSDLGHLGGDDLTDCVFKMYECFFKVRTLAE